MESPPPPMNPIWAVVGATVGRSLDCCSGDCVLGRGASCFLLWCLELPKGEGKVGVDPSNTGGGWAFCLLEVGLLESRTCRPAVRPPGIVQTVTQTQTPGEPPCSDALNYAPGQRPSILLGPLYRGQLCHLPRHLWTAAVHGCSLPSLGRNVSPFPEKRQWPWPLGSFGQWTGFWGAQVPCRCSPAVRVLLPEPMADKRGSLFSAPARPAGEGGIPTSGCRLSWPPIRSAGPDETPV